MATSVQARVPCVSRQERFKRCAAISTPSALFVRCSTVPEGQASARLPSEATAAQTVASSTSGSSRRAALAGLAAAAAAAAAPPREAHAAAVAEVPFCGVVDRVPGWAFTTPWRQGPVQLASGRSVWARVVGEEPSEGFLGLGKKGDASKLPLLVVHGGPGLSSRYLDSVELLCATKRRVAFFDQGGCGRTAKAAPLDQQRPWSESPSALQYYVDELAEVPAAIGYPARYHVLGEGWGAMLVAEATAQGRLPGAASLTLLSLPDSYAALVEDRAARLRDALPAEASAALLRSDGPDSSLGVSATSSSSSSSSSKSGSSSDSSSSSSDAAVKEAYQEYSREVLCRRGSGSACVRDSVRERAEDVRRALCGGYTFKTAGELEGWHLPPGAITLPALLAYGDGGEVSASTAARAREALPGAKDPPVFFQGSGAYCHIDGGELFLERVDEFLSGVDAAAGLKA